MQWQFNDQEFGLLLFANRGLKSTWFCGRVLLHLIHPGNPKNMFRSILSGTVHSHIFLLSAISHSPFHRKVFYLQTKESYI